jgi:hypothetical protein
MWHAWDGRGAILLDITDYTGRQTLLKFRVIFIVLTLLNLNMTTKLPYPLPMLREEGLT